MHTHTHTQLIYFQKYLLQISKYILEVLLSADNMIMHNLACSEKCKTCILLFVAHGSQEDVNKMKDWFKNQSVAVML